MPSASHTPDVDAHRVNAVLTWFETAGRDLPWRGGRATPWGVLVSEVMLQQTPVARVEPAWRAWMARWPSPAALSSATRADAVRAWGSLGYPRRAQRLWECAAAIVDRHHGEVPSDEVDLLALPGVGAYTAAAVTAFAHGRRSVVLDTNVRRVLARAWTGVEGPRTHLALAERRLADRVAPDDAGRAVCWAVASMELGALVCTARSPRCAECPLVGTCAWVAAGRPESPEPVRRAHPWHGTDRQVRGRVLALLRASEHAVNVTGHASLEDVEPGQLDRCLESLVADGLVTATDASRGAYRL